MTQLILIRHGETQWTAERRYQGHSDTDLNPAGRAQARALARRLLALKWDILYTSSLNRARQTAEGIAARAGKNPRVDSRLVEFGFGRWEGKTAGEIFKKKDPAFRHWCRGEWVRPPGGEKKETFRKRIAGFLRDVLKRHPGKKVVVVSHGGAIKMMISKLLDLPFRSFWSFRVDPASVSIVHFQGKFTQLIFLNDTSHLRKPTGRAPWRIPFQEK